ncbi:MAG: class III cytochrome C family protein [Magnetococcales bacterium]|nr:class III cytochrome C family protein [Magnetococcales bacterium]
MKRSIALLVGINLAIIAVLVFAYPRQTIAPGTLIAGHASLAEDCFACHVPFRGTPSRKCVACHKGNDIGVTTTKGKPLPARKSPSTFHRTLKANDCVACHADHAGVVALRPGGRFSHQSLGEATRRDCNACHAKPADTLHRPLSGPCHTCHGTEKWRPATFDHTKWFTFDRDHAAACSVCHTQADYRQYTCYGCHEHTPGKIRAEHIEEGIRDYERCVACHRNADKEAAERGQGKWPGASKRKHHDDDD